MTTRGGMAVAATVTKLSLVLAISIFAASLAAHAQLTGKVYRIGYLSGGSATASARYVEAFRQGLRELGWVEGQNIVIDYRFAEGRFDRLPDLAAELVRLKVDVIAAGPTPPALAAKKATGTIPIVMLGAAQPVELGLVASLARPGGNVTGMAWSVNLEIIAKGVELLKEAVPKVRRVAVLSNPANPSHTLAIRDVKASARSSGVQLQLLEARGPSEFDGAFAAMAKQRVEALLVVADSMFSVHRARLADLATKNRLPSMLGLTEDVEAGGLMSYGPSIVANYRRAVVFVDKILKGAKPADLPVEQPTKFELVINLKTAKALGLKIPPSLLQRADQVIE
jgi:putative tryptophan/tyrosine transport system substrate-binding protein